MKMIPSILVLLFIIKLTLHDEHSLVSLEHEVQRPLVVARDVEVAAELLLPRLHCDLRQVWLLGKNYSFFGADCRKNTTKLI